MADARPAPPPEPPRRDDDPVVRAEVARLLRSSPSWRALSEPQRAAMTEDMVRVGTYLTRDRGWLASRGGPDEPVRELSDRVRSRVLEEEGGDPSRQAATTDGVRHELVGADFRAGALREGVEGFRNLVDTVDFPAFVSGLIQGVFQAIVDASIQQMQAYGELMAATAKTVGAFADDHISADQAREQLLQRHPGGLKLEQGRLKLTDAGEETQVLAAYAKDGKGAVDLSDEGQEQALVQSVRLEMARQRQKMLALMVLMGINRIIVTNGRINAKVVFDVKTTDTATRAFSHSKEDARQTSAGTAAAAWAPWGAGGGYAHTSHRTLVKSSLDENSTANAEMKAKLSGDVRVNFRSETLPPERMIDALQMGQLQNLAGQTAPQGGGS